MKSNGIQYYTFFSLSSNIFFRKLSHDDTYIHIYTRDSIQRRLFSVSFPRKSNFFAGSFLLVLLLRRSYRLESERKNPATDPAAPLISGDKEAGRKIGRGDGARGGGWTRVIAITFHPGFAPVIYAVKRLCHFTAIVRNKATARFKKRSPAAQLSYWPRLRFNGYFVPLDLPTNLPRHLLAKILGHARK